MFNRMKGFSQDRGGIYILQSTTNKFMWKLQTKHGLLSILKVVLNRIGNRDTGIQGYPDRIPDIGWIWISDTRYPRYPAYQISGRISDRFGYPWISGTALGAMAQWPPKYAFAQTTEQRSMTNVKSEGP